MIVVDPSALIAVLKGEQGFEPIRRFLYHPPKSLVISTASLLEAFISGERRSDIPGNGANVIEFARDLKIEAIPFDVTQMAWAIEGYERFGKGRSEEPAALNFDDCFSYGLAKSRAAPLLFVGEDFTKTDVAIALPLPSRKEF